ncbi:MAG: hypothetical protein KAT71_02415 [Gammaproteobacteria bacterium]|nr:hypothetical protein [Gammaproteobacteria bacterium]
MKKLNDTTWFNQLRTLTATAQVLATDPGNKFLIASNPIPHSTETLAGEIRALESGAEITAEKLTGLYAALEDLAIKAMEIAKTAYPDAASNAIYIKNLRDDYSWIGSAAKGLVTALQHHETNTIVQYLASCITTH